MSILDGIKNFLELVNENWTTIVVIIGLVIAITKKAITYFGKSDEEDLNILYFRFRSSHFISAI